MNPDAAFSPALIGIALLGLVPVLFMALTAFAKISTVLLIVRSAIGTPAIPSNVIVIALSAALTFVAMAPVGEQVLERATPAWSAIETTPLDESAEALLAAVREPLRTFYFDNSTEQQRHRFLDLLETQKERKVPAGERDLLVLLPAFLVSELIEAFAVGFAIFLPFLVVDLLVGSVLTTLGMQSVNPSQIALPVKLLLFVSVDGWGLLAETLIRSYSLT